MSSSQQPSNNNNNNPAYRNQLLDYENDDSANLLRNLQQQSSGNQRNDTGQFHGNTVYQQMYPFQEDIDEDIPEEIINELNTRAQRQSRINDEDESVFSDDVQNAFKKYQNEYSNYGAYNDTLWDNRFSDDEQEELFAQMEECWNYMAQETNPVDTPKNSMEQSQSITLNPDATEFKPSWLKSSSNSTNEESIVTLPSGQPDEQQKKN